jgi:hypothetical protein
MTLNRAGDEIQLGGDAKLAFAIDEDAAVAHERGEVAARRRSGIDFDKGGCDF